MAVVMAFAMAASRDAPMDDTPAGHWGRKSVAKWVAQMVEQTDAY